MFTKMVIDSLLSFLKASIILNVKEVKKSKEGARTVSVSSDNILICKLISKHIKTCFVPVNL